MVLSPQRERMGVNPKSDGRKTKTLLGTHNTIGCARLSEEQSTWMW